MPVMAASEVSGEILLKRVVLASLNEKRKLQLNVIWINQTINFGNKKGEKLSKLFDMEEKQIWNKAC